MFPAVIEAAASGNKRISFLSSDERLAEEVWFLDKIRGGKKTEDISIAGCFYTRKNFIAVLIRQI